MCRRLTASRGTSSTGPDTPASVGALYDAMCRGKASGRRIGWMLTATTRSMAFSSSWTLPGHE